MVLFVEAVFGDGVLERGAATRRTRPLDRAGVGEEELLSRVPFEHLVQVSLGWQVAGEVGWSGVWRRLRGAVCGWSIGVGNADVGVGVGVVIIVVVVVVDPRRSGKGELSGTGPWPSGLGSRFGFRLGTRGSRIRGEMIAACPTRGGLALPRSGL